MTLQRKQHLVAVKRFGLLRVAISIEGCVSTGTIEGGVWPQDMLANVVGVLPPYLLSVYPEPQALLGNWLRFTASARTRFS